MLYPTESYALLNAKHRVSQQNSSLSLHMPFPDFFKTNYSVKKVRNWHCESESYSRLILLKGVFEWYFYYD